MQRPPVKSKTRSRITPEDQGFEVTREEVIGFVSFGNGEHSPPEAAMLLIGHHTDMEGNGGKYRFPGPHENSTITVTVEIS